MGMAARVLAMIGVWAESLQQTQPVSMSHPDFLKLLFGGDEAAHRAASSPSNNFIRDEDDQELLMDDDEQQYGTVHELS